MSTIEVNGKQFEVDEEGYLANLNEWSLQSVKQWLLQKTNL